MKTGFFKGATCWEGYIGRLWFRWPRKGYWRYARPQIGWDYD